MSAITFNDTAFNGQKADGWVDANGNYHPQGTDDLKLWINLKTNLLNDVITRYATELGVDEGFSQRVFFKLLKANRQTPAPYFRKLFIDEMASEYEKNKDQIKLVNLKKAEVETKSRAEVKEESVTGVSQPKSKVIRLGGGLIFAAEDFENLNGNKLKLKSGKKAIAISEEQIKKLDEQL